MTSEVGPRAESLKYFYWPYTRNIGIQMNQKELTKTFMMISNWKKTPLAPKIFIKNFKPELTIVIFTHYKPRIAVAILDLQWMKMTCSGLKIKENHHVLANQIHGNFHSKTLGCRKFKSDFRDVRWCFNASWGLKGLRVKNDNSRDWQAKG